MVSKQNSDSIYRLLTEGVTEIAHFITGVLQKVLGLPSTFKRFEWWSTSSFKKLGMFAIFMAAFSVFTVEVFVLIVGESKTSGAIFSDWNKFASASIISFASLVLYTIVNSAVVYHKQRRIWPWQDNMVFASIWYTQTLKSLPLTFLNPVLYGCASALSSWYMVVYKPSTPLVAVAVVEAFLAVFANATTILTNRIATVRENEGEDHIVLTLKMINLYLNHGMGTYHHYAAALQILTISGFSQAMERGELNSLLPYESVVARLRIQAVTRDLGDLAAHLRYDILPDHSD